MGLRGNNNNINNIDNNKKAKVAPVAAAGSPTVDSKGNTNNGSRSGSNRYPGGSVGDLRSVTTPLEVVELSPPSDVKLREKWACLVQGESARRVARVNRRLLSELRKVELQVKGGTWECLSSDVFGELLGCEVLTREDHGGSAGCRYPRGDSESVVSE